MRCGARCVECVRGDCRRQRGVELAPARESADTAHHRQQQARLEEPPGVLDQRQQRRQELERAFDDVGLDL